MKNLSRVAAFALTFWLFGSFAAAANSLDVAINEIAWMGTEVEGVAAKNWWRYEWLELYNNTKKPISLDGWKIEFYRAKLDWEIRLKKEIPAGGYYLAAASNKIFSDCDLNYSNLEGRLNNQGQKIILKDNSGNIIDQIDCFSSGKWFAGDNAAKKTMERVSAAASGSEAANWKTSQNTGGTPRAENSPAIKILPKAEGKNTNLGKISQKGISKKEKEGISSFFVFAIASTIAISSGIATLVLKRKTDRKIDT